MKRKKKRSKNSKKKVLPKHLLRQIDAYINALEKYNKKLPHPRSKENYPYLRYFFARFIEDQNARAIEIASKEYENILAFANAQFPVKTLWTLCIDGRVLSILSHGASAGVGNSIQVPGGMLREFVRGKDGKLKLKRDSNFANLLTRLLNNKKVDIIAEVFDSHVGCAARQAEEQVKGRNRADMGLFADVSHKLQMAIATKQFIADIFGETKKVITMLTSFDPHTGYLYTGLGTEPAMSYAAKHGHAYTKDVLDHLVREGKIISTEALVEEKSIRLVFEKHAFSLDWKNDYVKSARLFWEAIANMKKQLLPLLEKRIIAVLPELREDSEINEIGRKERAMLLLTNAFSGFLHNQGHETHTTHYPYGVHREEGVKVTEGGSPPYKLSMFAVFSYEEKNLPAHIELSAALVRKNRLEQRVVDASNNFTDPQKFAQAALPLIVQEIIRDPLTEKDWQKIAKIDWSDLPEDWEKLTDNEFYSYLHKKGNIPFGVAHGINNLRRKMAVLYEPYNPISSRLIEQYKVALPLIVDKYRRIHFLVPFVKLGFS